MAEMVAAKCALLWLVLGLWVIGFILGFSWPPLIRILTKEKLQLSPTSETYDLWVETPIPMYLEIYLFNWTNSEEFMKNKKIKPEFVEVGPFVFKEVNKRVDITWNDNETVSYNQTRMWSFVSEKSVDLKTQITNLNVIATTVFNMAEGHKNIVKLLLDILTTVYKEKLLITKSANEWLFDGISDKLLNFIKAYFPVPYDKFGWFYARNLSSSFDGRFTIHTGRDDIYDLGAIDQWNLSNKTKYYEGECSVVKGSTGELFAPLTAFQDNLTIFITDFCSSLTLKYSGMKSVKGLNGYHFVGDKSAFDNGTEYPSTKCFCSGECSPSGVRNVTSCRQAPLFISFPHFYLADPSYVESIIGMTPNKSKHEFFLSIDPLTGIPLEVRAQLQLNVLLRPRKLFPMFSDVPEVYVPTLWFRQRAEITSELASKAKMLQTLGKLGLRLGAAISSLGLLLIVIFFLCTKFCPENKDFELIPDGTDETNSEN